MNSNIIATDFTRGDNLSIGSFNLIEENVKVGDNVKIMNYVELRKGTRIGDDCYIDSGVKSSGQNRVGNRVILRYASILAKGVKIEDDVFISPQLMTENVNQYGEEIGGAHIGVGDWGGQTKYRVFIGTNVTLAAGIEICPSVIIGSKTNVRKSITEPGVYIGNPARLLEPKNLKIKKGKNVIIESGATIGAQPTLFDDKGEEPHLAPDELPVFHVDRPYHLPHYISYLFEVKEKRQNQVSTLGVETILEEK